MRIGILFAGAAISAAAIVSYVVGCTSDNTINTTCPSYCQNIQTTCTGDAAQYPTTDNNATCLNICAAWEAGTPGVQGQNTVSCRNAAVSNAKDDPTAAMAYSDCVAGGVSSNVCPGDPSSTADPNDQCLSFCQTALALCGSLTNYEGGVPDCVSHCKAWDQVPFTGLLIGTTGDNLQCRTYHLELSQTGNPADFQTHCPHTGTPSARCFDVADAGTDSGSDAANDASGE
jgi:hypothetical protein